MNKLSRQHFSFIATVLLILTVLGCKGLDAGDGWQQQLAGKKLTRAKSSGSFSDRYNFWFCSNGQYLFKQETVGMSVGGAGTGSMASEDFERGRWSVDAGTLVMEPEEASRYEFQLSEGTDSNVIRLDGTPFLVTMSEECP